MMVTHAKRKQVAPFDGLAFYRQLTGRAPRPVRGSLDRQSLPMPLAYLTAHGLLTGAPRSEWATIRCPVHKSGEESHPSLRVSLTDGHFRCMACGVSGGDLVALHRLITGRGFRDAVRDLGGRFHGE